MEKDLLGWGQHGVFFRFDWISISPWWTFLTGSVVFSFSFDLAFVLVDILKAHTPLTWFYIVDLNPFDHAPSSTTRKQTAIRCHQRLMAIRTKKVIGSLCDSVEKILESYLWRFPLFERRLSPRLPCLPERVCHDRGFIIWKREENTVFKNQNGRLSSLDFPLKVFSGGKKRRKGGGK